MKNSIILIRHGESLGNSNGDYYKLPDCANILTMKGVDQCMELSKRIQNEMTDDFHGVHTTVFASKYQRAQLTAQIVTHKFKPQIHIDARINEVFHSDAHMPTEPREHVIKRVRSLVLQHEFNLILFTHGMLMGTIDQAKGGAKNCELRKYDREEFIEWFLK